MINKFSKNFANVASLCSSYRNLNSFVKSKNQCDFNLLACHTCFYSSLSDKVAANPKLSTNTKSDTDYEEKSVYLDLSITNSYNNLDFVLNQKNLIKLKSQKEKFLKKNFKYLLRSKLYDQNPHTKMTNPTVNYFAHSFIDRCSDKRKDKKWIDDHMKLDNTTFVLFHVDKPFVTVNESKNMFSLTKFSYSQVKDLLDSKDESNKMKCTHVFLGLEYEKNYSQLDKNELLENHSSLCYSPYSNPATYNKNSYKAWFAIDTSGYDHSIDNVAKLFQSQGQFFEGNYLRLIAIQDILESSIIAQARSVFCWLDRNKFCASCGHANEVDDAGFKLACKNSDCKSKNKSLNKIVPSNIHYPRVDPVAIMLIVNPAQTHLLLGRKRQFPKNMFSCLAGYIEAGESIEEAVRREAFEESGIYTDKVVYHSSQPWPFPSTLMVGCFAYATSDQIKIDEEEIQEARWFSLDEIDLIIKNSHPEGITIPTERTIAHQLIKYFSNNKPKL